MELEDLQRRALAARQFDVIVDQGVDGIGPIAFTLRVPTRHEASLAYMEGASGSKAASDVRFERALLVRAVIGWSGVQVRHVLPESPQAADDIEPDPAAIVLVLDAQPAWEDTLMPELLSRLNERQVAQDTAAKN